ncbi:hypothetical protein [Prauserella muralis]|uniref:Uncharacterized protein n=1 Tax=Prauserella muralis TaxID=588067 RepID=A0A2V4AZG5_9PSEU|nr:hypothetical protein [Prauserella muralis]PXY27411.1 hypothetical protein BAY60_13330 [Prauserella muralis]TWE22891.1 hypothetical protein FHX69_4147 [Prauserella muralis]
MTDQSTGEQRPPRDFAAFLLELAKGKTHRELSEALRDVVKGVTQTGKPGKLQLTLQFKKEKGTEALLIAGDVKKQAPVFDQPASIFYATELGDLQRTDPNQDELDYYGSTPKETTHP